MPWRASLSACARTAAPGAASPAPTPTARPCPAQAPPPSCAPPPSLYEPRLTVERVGKQAFGNPIAGGGYTATVYGASAAATPSAMVCRDADDTRRRLPERRRDPPSPAAAAACSEPRAPDADGPAGVSPCAASPPPIAHSAKATVSSAPRSTCVKVSMAPPP